MTATLKLRDENGNVYEIPALVGKKATRVTRAILVHKATEEEYNEWRIANGFEAYNYEETDIPITTSETANT